MKEGEAALSEDYPKQANIILMSLVRMLVNERLCWNEMMEIGRAIQHVQFHAKQLRQERESFTGEGAAGFARRENQ